MRLADQPVELVPQLRAVAGHRDRHVSVAALPRNLVLVPQVKQKTGYSCGNAATLAVLRYWRWDVYADVDEAALYLTLGTTEAAGTEPEPIAAFLQGKGGVGAEYRHGDVTIEDLERAVDAAQPPIVDLQAWRDDDTSWQNVWDAGHYVVLVGYDRDRLFFMDPSTMTPGAHAYLPRAELADRWHDLTGGRNERVEHMAIFVNGRGDRWKPTEPVAEGATKLG